MYNIELSLSAEQVCTAGWLPMDTLPAEILDLVSWHFLS